MSWTGFRKIAVVLRVSVFVALLVVSLAVARPTAASAAATDCKEYSYVCTPGYTGDNANGTWAWTYYGADKAVTSNGHHNCTLYAAWRLSQTGYNPGRNWGNAVDWAGAVGGGNHTPAVGSIAWWGGGQYGHVAYVEQVNGSQVYIRADNFIATNQPGYTSSGWVDASTVDLFLHPHDVATTGGSPVIRVEKRIQTSDNTNLVYYATGSEVNELWWRGGTGVTKSSPPIVSMSGIVDMDAAVMPDGEHLVYTATANTVYETWWYPGQAPSNPAPIASIGGIRRIQKTVQSDGTQQLYVMTNTGVYEVWWRPGVAPSAPSPIMTLQNPVSMVKAFEPDGSQAVYIADQEFVYQARWGAGAGIQIKTVIDISQRNVKAIDEQTLPDGTHLLTTVADTSVWESSWPVPASPTAALAVTQKYVAGGTGLVAVKSRSSSGTHDVFVASTGGVFEYWWTPGGPVHPATITSQPDVRDFDKQTNPDGAQAVYTATGSHVVESYWFNGGDGIHTGGPFA